MRDYEEEREDGVAVDEQAARRDLLDVGQAAQGADDLGREIGDGATLDRQIHALDERAVPREVDERVKDRPSLGLRIWRPKLEEYVGVEEPLCRGFKPLGETAQGSERLALPPLDALLGDHEHELIGETAARSGACGGCGVTRGGRRGTGRVGLH